MAVMAIFVCCSAGRGGAKMKMCQRGYGYLPTVPVPNRMTASNRKGPLFAVILLSNLCKMLFIGVCKGNGFPY